MIKIEEIKKYFEGKDKIRGRDLRIAIINATGLRLTPSRFYHHMAQLEDKGEIIGFYDDIIVSGFRMKQRFYKLPSVERTLHEQL